MRSGTDTTGRSDPTNGEGYESAVAYEVADPMNGEGATSARCR